MICEVIYIVINNSVVHHVPTGGVSYVCTDVEVLRKFKQIIYIL